MELPALSEITPVIENINYAKSSGEPEKIKSALADAKEIILKTPVKQYRATKQKCVSARYFFVRKY